MEALFEPAGIVQRLYDRTYKGSTIVVSDSQVESVGATADTALHIDAPHQPVYGTIGPAPVAAAGSAQGLAAALQRSKLETRRGVVLLKVRVPGVSAVEECPAIVAVVKGQPLHSLAVNHLRRSSLV